MENTRTIKGLSTALDAALLSTMDNKHGACLMRGNKIISVGTNNCKRSTIDGKLYPCIHAEIDAMHRAKTLTTSCFPKEKSRFKCRPLHSEIPLWIM